MSKNTKGIFVYALVCVSSTVKVSKSIFSLVLFTNNTLTTSVQFQKCSQLYTQSTTKCCSDVQSVDNGQTVHLCVSSTVAVCNCNRVTSLGQ